MKKNVYESVIVNKQKEIFETLLENPKVKIERIISNGQTSDNDFWYEQEEIEFVLLLSGEAILEFENNKKIHLKSGDYITIEAYEKHRVAFTSQDKPTIWLAIFVEKNQ